MPTNKPIISVIMPVYNTEKYLKEALESVKNQTFSDWELICVNDGSTDNSLNILLNFESIDARIKVISQLNSGSAAAARNVALSSCKGLYLHFLDSDDLLSVDCLEMSYKKIISTNADLIMPDLSYFGEAIGKDTKAIIGYLGNRQILLTPVQAFQASLKWNISGLGLYRMDIVKRFGFDETGMNGDEYSTRLLFLNCNKIGFSTGTYYYRQHIESTTKKRSFRLFDKLTTDFRILKLAEEYKTGDVAISICKNTIIWSIIKFQMLLYRSKEDSIINRKQEIQNLIRTYYDKVDSSYIINRGNFLQYLLLKLIFLNFNLLKIYAFIRVNIIPIFKNILNRNNLK